MTKTLTEQWRDDPDEILSPDEEVIHEQNKIIERLQEQINEANKIIIKRMNQDLDWEGGFDEDCTNYADKYGIELIEGRWFVK